MYKFTNGFIAYDKETANNLINAGFKLLEDKKITEIKEESKEENDKFENNNESVAKEYTGSKKTTRKI